MAELNEPLTAGRYRVTSEVSVELSFTEAGAARVEEYARSYAESASYNTVEEGRAEVLTNLAEWIGVHGRTPDNLDGYADLDRDDIKASREEWQPSFIDDPERVS